MNEHLTDTELRQFLLGDINEEERERIEKRFISDPLSKARILIAEEDLIEDYLEGSLPAAQNQQFLAQHGYTPKHLRRLKITGLIKKHAMTGGGAEVLDGPGPRRSSFLSRLWPPNMRTLIPALAVLMIAVIVSVVWLSRFSSRRTAQANQRALIERDLAELNSTDSSGQPSSQVLSLVLPPVSVRSVTTSNEVKLNPDTRVVELRLVWMQKEEYSGYRATVRRVGDPDQVTVNNLKLRTDRSGQVVIVKIHVQFLRRGQYQIDLNGIDNLGTSGPTQEYAFTVS